MILIFGLFLIIIFSISILAECQYKEEVSSGIYKQVLYDYNGVYYEEPITLYDFKCSCLNNDCNTYFTIKNNIDKSVGVNILYQIMITDGVNSIVHDKDKFIFLLKQFQFVENEKVNWKFRDCYIIRDSISYTYIKNNETFGKLEEIKNQTCKLCLGNVCLNDGDSCIHDFECGSGICSNTGNTAGHCISERSDFEKRIFSLESWKISLNETISSILLSITGLITKTNNHDSELINHEQRLSKIENTTIPFPNYFKYLSSSDRKDLVCGYAQDNHLTHLEDLGWICDIIYKLSRVGEKAICKCYKIQ